MIKDKAPAYAELIYPIFDFTGGLNTHASELNLNANSRFSLRPNQMTLCENMIRTRSGALVGRPGRAKVNSAAVVPPAGDDTIRSIFELRLSGGTSKILMNAGNSVYVLTGGDTWSSLGTVATSNQRMLWTQFRDVAIGTNGADAPVSYDGTTFQALAGSPPSACVAIASYRDRVWMAKGRTLYYSALSNHEDWTTANNAGNINIPISLGARVSALIPMWDRLIVFTHQQVFQLFGTSPATFELQAINLRYGHEGNHACVVAAGNDIFYASSRGAHSLAITTAQSETGDVAVNYASANIEPTWHDITPGNISNMVAVNDTMRNLVIFICNRNGSDNAEAMVGDYYHVDENGQPTWTTYASWPFASACEVHSLNSTPEVLLGGYDGFVYRQSAATDDAGTNISCRFEYATDLGHPGFIKTFRHLLTFAQATEGTLSVSASYDFGRRTRTTSMALAGEGDTIGSTFTIGVSTLGAGSGYQFKRLSFPGHGRFAVFSINYSSAQRLTFGGFLCYAAIRRAVIA